MKGVDFLTVYLFQFSTHSGSEKLASIFFSYRDKSGSDPRIPGSIDIDSRVAAKDGTYDHVEVARRATAAMVVYYTDKRAARPMVLSRAARNQYSRL